MNVFDRDLSLAGGRISGLFPALPLVLGTSSLERFFRGRVSSGLTLVRTPRMLLLKQIRLLERYIRPWIMISITNAQPWASSQHQHQPSFPNPLLSHSLHNNSSPEPG